MRPDSRPRLAIGAALLVVIVLAGVNPAAAIAPESTTTRVSSPGARGLDALLRGGPHPWLGHPNLSDVRDSLRAFYARRGDAPCWIEYGRPTTRARRWLEALGRLDAYGVPPADCDVPQIGEALAEADAGGTRSDEALGDLDVAITAAVARALRALHSGRLSPASVDSNLILLHRPLALSLTLDSLSQAGDPDDWLERVQPSFRQYRALREALARYRDWARDSVSLVSGRPPRLTTARPSAGVARLKLLLERVGDLRWGTVQSAAADSVADPKLIAALARFQRRHRLPPSGRLDSTTWSYLHGALDERIAQMGRTLEQYRWLPHELSAPLLFINIPAFKLEAMTRLDEPDSTVLHIDVVVGTAFKTQTPVLTAALTSLDFMPTWDVPPSIARDEVQPAALANPAYLAKNHMDLIRNMRVLPSTAANIAAIGHGVRVRQRAGPDNPLGHVKFVMPNVYDVYLHDSPARALFGARQRDFSHGCIRLKDPKALARFALRDRPDWPPARIDSIMRDTSTVTTKVRLPNPMLVAIVYATVEARENGRVLFHPDVYGHDRTFELLLAGASRDTVLAERSRASEARHPPPKPVASPFHPPLLPPGVRSNAPGPPGVAPKPPVPARDGARR